MAAYYNENDKFAAAWLRGAGNAICALQAQAFIEAYMSLP